MKTKENQVKVHIFWTRKTHFKLNFNNYRYPLCGDRNTEIALVRGHHYVCFFSSSYFFLERQIITKKISPRHKRQEYKSTIRQHTSMGGIRWREKKETHDEKNEKERKNYKATEQNEKNFLISKGSTWKHSFKLMMETIYDIRYTWILTQ